MKTPFNDKFNLLVTGRYHGAVPVNVEELRYFYFLGASMLISHMLEGGTIDLTEVPQLTVDPQIDANLANLSTEIRAFLATRSIFK